MCDNKSFFSAIPFRNEYKQTIVPGDEVLYIATSYGGWTRNCLGIYEGVYMLDDGVIFGVSVTSNDGFKSILKKKRVYLLKS